MRAVLTGAAGFVGYHLARRLLDEGWEVVGVDNFLTGSRENVRALQESAKSFSFVEHDCIEPLQVEGAVDWIYHFACPASPPRYLASPIETMRVSAEGTYHLLELARKKKAGVFLASTSEVYGDPHVHPQPEGYWGHVNPVGERSVYDEGKRYAEAMVSAYHRHYGQPVRIIRIFNTYGPRMQADDGRIVTNFVVRALRGESLVLYGEGSQTRSFQFVDDLVDGICRLTKVDYAGPVNLGNPDEYSVRQFADIIRELVPTAGPLEFGPLPSDDPKQRKPDIALAKRLLDWQPRVPVRTGLLRTVEYFREWLERQPK